MADARLEIDDVRTGARDTGAVIAGKASTGRSMWTWGLTMMLVSAAAAAAGWLLRTVPVAPVVRLEFSTPPTNDPSVAVSPDGTQVVFVTASGGPAQLWLRSIDGSVMRPLPGTERGTWPFWSPDGRSIGFFADVKLKRIDIADGSMRTLASDCAVPIGGTWAADGTILFADNPNGGIRRTTAQGGEPADLTRPAAPRERGHQFPRFLPDGRQFLFFVSGTAETKGVYIGQLDGSYRRLFDADGSASYAATGHLLFARGGKFYSQEFDASRGALSGEAVPVQALAGRVAVSASVPPTIASRLVSDKGQRQLLWLDRSGRELKKVEYLGGAAQGPGLSRDGRHVAVFRFIDGNMDVWSYDTTNGHWDRLTFAPGDDIYPIWSSDGRSLFYSGARNGPILNLFKRVLSQPPESEQPLLKSATGEFLYDLSLDGRYILFGRTSPKRSADIWALSLADAGAEPFEVVATEATEGLAEFSPDGKWIVYQSNKNGRDEIYMRPFPEAGAEVRVSSEGGIQPRWNPNGGKELFYVGADDRLMAVSITFRPGGAGVDVGPPVPLFATNIGSTVQLKYRQQYMVNPDGKSFVLNSTVGEGTASPVMVILNWKPGR